VKVWDAQTGRELLSLQGPPGTGKLILASVVFSPDGKRLASGRMTLHLGGNPGEVKVWDAQTGQELLTFPGASNSVAFSPDGKRLAKGAVDGEGKVWDAQTGQELLTLKGLRPVRMLAFSPDGKRLVSTSNERRESTVTVWDAQTGQELLTLEGGVSHVSFSPDGHRLAAGSADGAVTVWDATPLPEKP
jgi:WD40 repeat protein